MTSQKLIKLILYLIQVFVCLHIIKCEPEVYYIDEIIPQQSLYADKEFNQIREDDESVLMTMDTMNVFIEEEEEDEVIKRRVYHRYFDSSFF